MGLLKSSFVFKQTKDAFSAGEGVREKKRCLKNHYVTEPTDLTTRYILLTQYTAKLDVSELVPI